MGNWQLEAFKMSVYMMFPVAMFHYFNQPSYYEEYVIKIKQTMYPPPDKQLELQKSLKNLQRQQDLQLLEAMKENR